MKYSLCYLLKGDVGKFHKQLVKDLGIKFNEPYLLENPIPSHATLKCPFETNRIKEIENLLEEFVKHKKKEMIKIRKTHHFNNKAIYLQLDFSRKASKIFNDLIKELHKIEWLEWGEFDILKGKIHATLIYANTPKNFKRIWGDVSHLNPLFDLEFDNITILKKLGKYWRIHKIYWIK